MSGMDLDHDAGFPIEHLPFGVVGFPDGHDRVAVRIGGQVLDLAAAGISPEWCDRPSLNELMASGRASEVRARAQELLDGPALAGVLQPLEAVACRLPFAVGDFVDFNSSIHHASNVGRLLRPGGEAVAANWRQLPVGYHGRAGSIVVSGTPVRRPVGLVVDGEGPARLRPTAALDFELEVGFVVGRPGSAIAPDEADRHIFGAVLVNDWSARDIQAFESKPLGPLCSKSFATTISPWVVPLEALAAHLVPPPTQAPAPERHLRAERPWALEMAVAASLNGHEVARASFSSMYWTFAQQLAHLTYSGASVRTGDLLASGTVSGPGPGEQGCLLEATANGASPIRLGDGTSRRFLEDGDEVELTGWCGGGGRPRLDFGTCAGRIVPAGHVEA